MKRFLGTPGIRFLVIILLGLVSSLLMLRLALNEPQWSVDFAENDRVQSSRGTFTVEKLDILMEPGELGRQEDLRRFYARQDEWRGILEGESLQLIRMESSQNLAKSVRQAGDLPLEFWIPLIVGMGTLLIGGWIWSLKPLDLSIALFGFSGFSTFLSALPSAVYTSRSGPLSAALFQVLETANAWGAMLFGISVLALFLIYPHRLRQGRALALGQAVFFILWTLGFSLQWVPDFANISVIIVSLMALICVAIGGQYVLTRRDPASRASLIWLGLSVLIGAGAFVLFNTVPSLLGTTPLNQSYAFLSFLIIYLGLAAGLTRYRLFDVGQWALRFLFYSIAAALLILLDLLFIYGLGLGNLVALEISLLVIVFLYLPLRDSIWKRFTRKERVDGPQLLEEALRVAFAPTAVERVERWERFLRKTFAPLRLEFIEEKAESVALVEDGLGMILPPVAHLHSVLLSYPWSGRGLFNRYSLELASQMVSLIRQVESGREAYDRGVQEERRRVAQDLHDDVGSRLLSGLHSNDSNLRGTIQGAIADIRSIVSGITGEQIPLTQFVQDARYEMNERLTAANIEMRWEQETAMTALSLDYHLRKALSSALREVVSNVIRHSRATILRVHVSIQKDHLCILLQDNGTGFDVSAAEKASGYGLKSLRRRLQDISGVCEISSSSSGTIVKISSPLP